MQNEVAGEILSLFTLVTNVFSAHVYSDYLEDSVNIRELCYYPMPVPNLAFDLQWKIT